MVWLVEFSMIWYVKAKSDCRKVDAGVLVEDSATLVKTRSDHSPFFRPSFKSISNIEIFAECNDAWKNGLIAT